MKPSLKNERRKLLFSIERFLDGPMIFLGFAWLVLILVELIRGLPPAWETVSYIIWGIFLFDFIIEFLLAPDKLQFFKRSWLTAFSLVIPAIRILRLFRILRLIRGVRVIRIVSSLNRSIRSLGSAMRRRGFGYVVLLVLVVIFGGAAGMYAIERSNPGFEDYGMALWWTSMRVITAGSDFWPASPEGRILAFLLSLFGYAVFGYVTATLATYFLGRDAEEKSGPVAGAKDINELKKMILTLSEKLDIKEGKKP